MATVESGSIHATHEVLNQPPPLLDYNAYELDLPLREAVQREGGGWAEGELRAFGAETGSAHLIEQGFLANRYLPELHTHDPAGHRIDEVRFHPAYHALMAAGVRAGAHAFAWNHERPGAHVARAGFHYLLGQAESSVMCPLTMTFAGVPALAVQPEVAAEWTPRLTAREYDPRLLPATEKKGCLMGMAMTEKQGGSDVRSNTTTARPEGAGGPGAAYRLTGHKWFCSAPMNDVFLSLAQSEGGLTCFLVPRWLPDGTKNTIHLMRLKDKLGNRANASGEVEFLDTWGVMIGEEGRGVRTIIEMVNHTRLDCIIGATSVMRQALTQAMHHARHRAAFGRPLLEQPLMRNVLADLALETEASVAVMMRLARAYDEARRDPGRAAFVRIATSVTKYYVCKRAPAMVYEALECHGGGGYVEESIMARLYREAPVNSVWEGSGNVICLDVLRALAREPETLPALLAELETARGCDARYDRLLAAIGDALAARKDAEYGARTLVAQIGLALQGCALFSGGNPAVAEAFCAGRLAPQYGAEYGRLPSGVDVAALLERAMPGA